MAIQNRRGAYGDFDPSKMVPGEFAVVQSNDPNATDGKSVYLAFAAGDVKRLATHDDMVAEITDITEDVIEEVSTGIEEAIHDDMETASAAANTATQKAADASHSAEEAAQTVATIIDNTLSQSGKAADAQKTGLITAPQYSTSATYNVGDYVIYGGSLYRCTTKISTAESWTSGHWTAAKVGSELSDLKSAFDMVAYTGDADYSTFIQGARGTSDPSVIIQNSARCTTGAVFSLKAGDSITVSGLKSGQKYVVAASNGTDSGWIQADMVYVCAADANYFLNVANADGTTNISPSDIEIELLITDQSSLVAANKRRLDIHGSVLKSSKEVTADQIMYSLGGEIKEKPVQISSINTIEKAYINNAGYIRVNDSGITAAYKVSTYSVLKGDAIKLTGENARLNGNYPFACFFTNLNKPGTVIVSGTATATDYDTAYTVTADGYIAVAEVEPYKTLDVSLVAPVVDCAVKKLFSNPVTYVKDGAAIQPTANYPTYYINNQGDILTLGQSYTSFIVYQIPVEAGKYYIIDGRARLNGSFPIVGFKTTGGTSGKVTILLSATDSYADYNTVYHAESNGYLFVAATGYGILAVTPAVSKTDGELSLDKANASVTNPWYGKKVVWLGTSVSFGQYATKSYAQEIANYLGFTLVNCSVPGLSITLNNDNIKQYGSLSASKAEYSAAGWTIPDAPVTPYVPGGNYNNYYRTWENVFTEENADADLWVFDCVPNTYPNFGLDDWNAFDKNAWAYNDSSSFAEHRNTFIGALIFLMDKLYQLNPNARMVFMLGSSFDYASGKSELQTVSAQWNIGIIDLWAKVNTSPKSLLQLKSEGGTNPHPSTFAHELMGKMLVGEFNRFA